MKSRVWKKKRSQESELEVKAHSVAMASSGRPWRGGGGGRRRGGSQRGGYRGRGSRDRDMPPPPSSGKLVNGGCSRNGNLF